MVNRAQLVIRVMAASMMLMSSLGWSHDGDADEKPFAETHLVLQLSDQEKISGVLDVANNLIKHYGGPDFIDIEIVTFGPGVRLLFKDGEYAVRIASLTDNGVRFYICENTLNSIEHSTGIRPLVNPNAESVPAGVAKILESVAEGFTLVKP